MIKVFKTKNSKKYIYTQKFYSKKTSMIKGITFKKFFLLSLHFGILQIFFLDWQVLMRTFTVVKW